MLDDTSSVDATNGDCTSLVDVMSNTHKIHDIKTHVSQQVVSDLKKRVNTDICVTLTGTHILLACLMLHLL